MLEVGRKAALAILVGAAIVAFAVLLTPVAYRAALALGWIDADEFLKVTRRLLLIPAVVAILVGLRPWRDGGLRSYGLVGSSLRLRPVLVAYALTLALGLSILASHFAAGWLAWEDPLDWGGGARRLGRWAVVAWVLAFVEELFFRGWMDRRLGARLAPLWTALVVAAIYAALHAFKPSRLDVEVTYDVAGAWTGFVWWVRHLFDLGRFGPTFVGLFLFSLVLTALWRRTRTLWIPIAVHAAGITLLRSYGAFTVRDPQRTWAGTKELVDGPVLWALFVVLLVVFGRRPSARKQEAGGLS